MSKKKENKLMRSAKDTMALGTMTTLGSYMFGRVGAAHPVTAPTASAVTGGLNILQTGQLAKNAMTIADMMQDQVKPKKKRR